MMGAVMKHAGNILRLFIIASAMFITTVLSIIVFHFNVNVSFCVAGFLVLLAIALYHRWCRIPAYIPFILYIWWAPFYFSESRLHSRLSMTPLTNISKKETFIQDFVIILKHLLQKLDEMLWEWYHDLTKT